MRQKARCTLCGYVFPFDPATADWSARVVAPGEPAVTAYHPTCPHCQRRTTIPAKVDALDPPPAPR